MRGPSCAFVPKKEVDAISSNLKSLGMNATTKEIISTVTLMQSYNYKNYKPKDFRDRLFISKLKDNIESQRKLREKEMTKSELDNIEGIGKTKRENLLKHFGTIAVSTVCAVLSAFR